MHHIHSYAGVHEDDAEEPEQTQGRKNFRRSALKVAGVLTLLACAGVAAAKISQTSTSKVTTARMLLESPEVVSMVTQFHMSKRIQRGKSAAFTDMNKARTVIEKELKTHTAAEARRLDSTEVTNEEQEGMKHVLRHLLDDRVQRLAKDGGKDLIKESQGTNMDLTSQQRRLQAFFKTRSAEVKQLRSEIFDGLPGRLNQRRNVVQAQRQLRSSARPRQLQAFKLPAVVTTAAPSPFGMPQFTGAPIGFTTTPADPLDCQAIDEEIEDAKGAASMMKMAMGDQIDDMAKTQPAVKDASKALVPAFDFLECVNDMRKAVNNKCQGMPTDTQDMMPNAEDMEKGEQCWSKFQPFALKVLANFGVEKSDLDMGNMGIGDGS